MVFIASVLNFQLSETDVEIKPANSLVTSVGKALNEITLP